MSAPNNDIGAVIEQNRQVAHAEQAKAKAQAQEKTHPPRGKQIFVLVLLVALALVLFSQYPRFSAPYAWPDPASNPDVARAELIEVIGLIETYRLAQGRYPAVVGQLTLPEHLAALVASSMLVYRATDTAYTLDWTLPHWHTTYDSQTEHMGIESLNRR